VVVSLPEDMLRQTCRTKAKKPLKPERAKPGVRQMKSMRTLLAKARRPMMIVGGGGWTDQGRADILAFAEANGVPACVSFRRNDLVDNRHPCYAGELGIGPSPELLARIKESDLLLAAGARLCEITSQGYVLPMSEQTLIHAHAGAGELGLVFKPTLAIHASPDQFAAAGRALKPVDGARWRGWTKMVRSGYVQSLTPTHTDSPLDLGRVMANLNETLPSDAVIAVDAGNFSGWPQRFLSFGGGRRLLGPTSGAMGYGVHAAVAAKIAEPGRSVVGFVGDGGFAMTGQELATAALHGVSPMIVVFNNSMYGTIRMHQERRHPGRVIGTGLSAIDFAALARAYGAHGERVEKTEDFAPAFRRAKDSGKPALIELISDPERITTLATLAEVRGADL